VTHSALKFDLTPPSEAQLKELIAQLDPESVRILRHHGTEAPFCGGFNDHEQDGIYVCGLCALPLFDSPTKFHSGSGWPSFFDPVSRDHIHYIEDNSHGMRRVEIRCARCDSHLGHVFPDGPRPSGDRYCLNSAALRFVAVGVDLPDLLGRDEPKNL